MTKIRPTKTVLGITLGVTAVLASFGIAVAAVVQVSRPVPATVNLGAAQVIASDNLVVSWDEAGNDLVNGMDFSIVELQPPLHGKNWTRERVFVRNDSDTDLQIIGPCDEVFDNGSQLRIGLVDFNSSIDNIGACEWHDPWVIGPGQTMEGFVTFGTDEFTEVGPGAYPVTIVFGAVGDTEVQPPDPLPNNSVVMAVQNLGPVNGVPYLTGLAGATRATGGIDEHLFVFENGNPLTPELLESWSIDPAGTKFSGTLKQGIPWNAPVGFEYVDFGELNSNDVVEWFNRSNGFTNPGTTHGDGFDLAGVFGVARTTGSHSFEVDLHNPIFFCLPISQFGCLAAEHRIEKVTTVELLGEDWARSHHVGTGPFVQSEDCGNGDECTLYAIENHWRATPDIAAIRAIQVQDDQVKIALLNSGNVDMALLDVTNRNQIVDGVNFRFLETMPGGFVGQSVIFSGNLWEELHARTGEPLNPWDSPVYDIDRPWLGDPWQESHPQNVRYADTNNPPGMTDMEQARLVRLALSTAIDRADIIASFVDGAGTPIYSEYMGPEYPGWNPVRQTGCFDVDGNSVTCSGTVQSVQWELAGADLVAADALLTAAGFPAGTRFDDFGQLTLQSYAAEVGPVGIPIADEIIARWAALGLNAQPLVEDYGGVISPRMRQRIQYWPVFKNGNVHSNVFPLDSPLPLVDTSSSRPGWGVGFESPAGAQWLFEIFAEQDKNVREQKHLNWVDYSMFWVQYAGVFQIPKGIVVNNRIQSWVGRQQHYQSVSTNPEFIVLN